VRSDVGMWRVCVCAVYCLWRCSSEWKQSTSCSMISVVLELFAEWLAFLLSLNWMNRDTCLCVRCVDVVDKHIHWWSADANSTQTTKSQRFHRFQLHVYVVSNCWQVCHRHCHAPVTGVIGLIYNRCTVDRCVIVTHL